MRRGDGREGKRLPGKESGPEDGAEREKGGWPEEVLFGTTERRRMGRGVAAGGNRGELAVFVTFVAEGMTPDIFSRVSCYHIKRPSGPRSEDIKTVVVEKHLISMVQTGYALWGCRELHHRAACAHDMAHLYCLLFDGHNFLLAWTNVSLRSFHAIGGGCSPYRSRSCATMMSRAPVSADLLSLPAVRRLISADGLLLT